MSCLYSLILEVAIYGQLLFTGLIGSVMTGICILSSLYCLEEKVKVKCNSTWAFGPGCQLTLYHIY